MPLILRLFLILSFLLFLTTLSIFPIEDSDIWYHLAQGRWIVEHNFDIPKRHQTLYTIDLPETNFAWATEIGLFLLYKNFGFSSIIIVKAIIISIYFAILIYISVGLGVPLILSLPLLTLGVLVSAERFLVRTEHIGYLWLVMMMGILYFGKKMTKFQSASWRTNHKQYQMTKTQNSKHKFRTFEFKILNLCFNKLRMRLRVSLSRTLSGVESFRISPGEFRILFFIPLLFLLWINTHGSFVLGLILLWLFAVIALFKKVSWRKLLLIIAAVSSTLVILLHPNRLEALYSTFDLLPGISSREGLVTQKTYEFQSPFTSFHQNMPYVFFFKILLAVYWGAFFIGVWHGKSSLFSFLTLVVATFLAFSSARHINTFALLGFLPAVEGLRKISNFKFQISNLKMGLLLLGFSIVFLSAAFYIIRNGYSLGTTYRTFGLGVKPIIPDKAVTFLDNNQIFGNMLNQLEIGSYLNWATFPRRKMFIDGFALYPDWFMKQYLSMSESKEKTEKVIDQYNIDYALVMYPETEIGKSVPDYLSQSSAWALVYWDDYYLLFLKKVEKFLPIIERFGYQYADPVKLSRVSFVERLSKEEGSFLRRRIIEELERTVSQNPKNSKAHILLGSMLEGIGDWDGAIREYQQGMRLNLSSPLSYLLLSGILVKREDYQQAQELLNKALSINPNLPGAYLVLGQIEEAKKNYRGAIGYYRKALFRQPNFAAAYFRLGVIHASSIYDRPKAQQYLLKAIQLGLEENQAQVAKEILQRL